MQDEYKNPMLSLTIIANQFSMSESTFSRLFKMLTGEPFSVALEKMRLQKDSLLLEQTDYTVSTIAETVGYNSVQTFGRAFKRYYMLSPDAWRKLKRVKPSDT